MPMRNARPLRAKQASSTTVASGASSSTREIARASATRSPRNAARTSWAASDLRATDSLLGRALRLRHRVEHATRDLLGRARPRQGERRLTPAPELDCVGEPGAHRRLDFLDRVGVDRGAVTLE